MESHEAIAEQIAVHNANVAACRESLRSQFRCPDSWVHWPYDPDTTGEQEQGSTTMSVTVSIPIRGLSQASFTFQRLPNGEWFRLPTKRTA